MSQCQELYITQRVPYPPHSQQAIVELSLNIVSVKSFLTWFFTLVPTALAFSDAVTLTHLMIVVQYSPDSLKCTSHCIQTEASQLYSGLQALVSVSCNSYIQLINV